MDKLLPSEMSIVEIIFHPEQLLIPKQIHGNLHLRVDQISAYYNFEQVILTISFPETKHFTHEQV
jgi:hypothetical protein